jgi:hypothetical protein
MSFHEKELTVKEVASIILISNKNELKQLELARKYLQSRLNELTMKMSEANLKERTETKGRIELHDKQMNEKKAYIAFLEEEIAKEE